jgi:CubicO group peptidase (beta-lactamase class C family)
MALVACFPAPGAPARGDPELAADLDELAGRGTRSVAAAAIDLGANPATRFAFIGATASTRFEIGSATKALTGRGSLIPPEGITTTRAGQASGMFWVIESVPGISRTMIWHNGQTGGYSAFLALYPLAGRGVVVLANVARAAGQRRIALGLAKRRWPVA